MSNYSVLKQDINNNIYENQTQQITGTVLNAILNEMTASLGAGYQFAGVATVGMNPGDPDQRVFYLAGEGIYTSFGGIQVPAGKLGVLKWDNRWTLQTIDGLGGGGANLTGYVSVASTDDLPDEGQPTLGYLCGTNLYLYVGEGGDTKDGKYQNCGSFRGPEGAYIQDIEQTETSHENGGRNTIKMTLSDGRSFNAYVHNGTTSSGLFPTLAALQAAYPTPVVGQYAFVGAGFPADIYVCTTAGTWTDSGEDYDGDNVDLTDYATKAEVNQLEAEVTDIDDTINGKQIVDKSDTVGTLLNQYISASHDTHEGVAYSNYNLYKSTDYLPVVGGSTIMISVFGTNSSTGDAGIAFYDSNKAVIPNTGLKYLNESAVNNDVRTIVVPSGASYTRTTIDRNIGSTVVFKVVVFGENYEERISKLESETDALSAENAELKSSLISLDTELMNLDDKSIISVDLMQMVHALNNISSLDYMDVLSASESSITLSSADAQKFPASPTYGTVAVVGFSNGEYKVVYFGSPSGTTIPRASFETTDLTNATKVQSLHDTLPGANGQHLSPSGYIAMGKFVADEIQRQASMIDKNWLGGLVFNKLGPSKGYQNTDENNAVYDLDDNVVCRPEFYNWMWGSYTPNGNNVPNGRGVGSSAYNALANGWVQKAYYFIQGKKDAYIEFPIEIHGTGFVEIQAAKRMRYSTSNGGCRLDVFADGENVGSYELTLNQTRYVFENVTVSNELRVRFTLLDNADTEVSIYSIGMWKMYQGVNTPNISSFTKIAVLGDSWTQFPGVGNGLSDHSSWNEVITRPDGTNGDGYGYFTRELSRYTGASVDNWGKANMTAENWGLVKIDEVLNHAFYDYLIVEFFINDINAGTPSSSWISNIKAICNKCKRAGVRPVFIMPCGTNSYSQATSLGIWHEAVLEGLGKK